MKLLNKGFVLILISALLFITGFHTGQIRNMPDPKITTIDFEQYHQLIETKKSFILYIGRASCKNCAITSLCLNNCVNSALPIYHLELERYYQDPVYEDIKKELGIIYVPSIKYIENGSMKYHMNSPLDGRYFEEGADKQAILWETEEKIRSFIMGASGFGPVIDEEIQTSEIKAEPIIIPGGNSYE